MSSGSAPDAAPRRPSWWRRIVPIVLFSTLLTPAVLFGVLYVWAMWPYWTFPTKSDVEDNLNRYEQAQATADRVNILAQLLDELRFTDSNEMDRIVQFAFDELVARYKVTGDEAILLAFERTRIDAHYGEWLCAEYARFTESPRLWERLDAKPDVRPAVKSLLSLAEVRPAIQDRIDGELRKPGTGNSRPERP